MITKDISYQAGDTTCVGYVAYNETTNPKPLVLIVHDWTGCNEFVKEKARQLAELGYVGFAVDMYGEQKNGANNEEKASLMMPLINDRNLLLSRMQTALNAGTALKEVNDAKVAAIGFCFGGLCVLDLARSGASIAGVVSLHGALHAPQATTCAQIKANVLALHGYTDPMVSPKELDAFCVEMEQAGCDWQVHAFGKTYHAFTNPQANDKAFGTVYSAKADKRAGIATKNFLSECFA